VLVAHKIIDALVMRRGSKHRCIPVLGCGTIVRTDAAEKIQAAQKFDFGTLPLIPMNDEPGSWDLPGLTDDENSFWRDGFIPLPFPVVWYEWVLGDSRSGLLVEEISATEWKCQRVDYVRDMGNGDVLYTGLYATVDREAPAGYGGRILGDKDTFEWAKRYPKIIAKNIGAEAHLAIYLTLMLTSKTTEVRKARISAVQAMIDRSKNRTPMPAHRTVVIVPERFQYAWDSSGRKHRSPRLHWRRSHLRVIHKGMPEEKKIVIARMLVGKAELGEVSHDYRVAVPAKG
jgi:hypothetical protein